MMQVLSNSPDAHAAVTTAHGAGAYAVLDQFGVIDARGPEAAAFLHNQLTNDVSGLATGAAALGGLCSPKGRLIASFLYWRQVSAAADGASASDSAAVDGVRLLISADIREAIQKRLSMFILRSKVKLIDATPELAVVGLSAPAGNAAPLLTLLGSSFDAIPDVVRGSVDGTGQTGTLIRLAESAGYTRFLWVMPRAELAAVLGRLDSVLSPAAASAWDWLDVNSGEARITAGTQDMFVPQMINFEAIGGVSFRKGCYPGQEIVARSQYRGTVKRRATLGNTAAARPGEEVFDESDPLQPCGHIVNAAPAPDGGTDCLVELKLSLAADARLHVGSIDGPLLAVRALPYALPEIGA
jgi:folate-binding protein YgfZ